MCRYLFRLALRCDGAFGTTDRAAVVLAWPPGREWPSLWEAFRAGGLGFLWRIGRRGTRFIMRLEKELDAARRAHLADRPHWYVPLLGVRPDSQGKGLSRAVLRPVFDAADRARVPVYLETVPESNVAIYRRLGFELVGNRMLSSGLSNWELLREPKGDQSPVASMADV
jgi:GNAT superfamily N-acetyltransferase